MMLNLRKLNLRTVAVSLPALLPVATRLHELILCGSRLEGSADGFLTKGWTALTSLSLTYTRMENATLTAALELPALKDVRIRWFTGHQGGELQLDQLTGSCPQVSRLEFQLGRDLAQAAEVSKQSCRLLNLKQLADLRVMGCSLQANVDLDLPPSLTQLQFGGSLMSDISSVDFFWALREAVKCVGRGAQLHRLICSCAEAYLRHAQWGASLEQHRRLGYQLGSLRELQVLGNQEQLLSAVGAVASAAPCLVRLEIVVTKALLQVEVSPICSASLESIRVEWQSYRYPELEPPQVLLTLLPGCTRLQKVVVQFKGTHVEGTAVWIRCHCCNRRCIVPVDGAFYHKRLPEEVWDGTVMISDVAVKFLHMPPSKLGVQDYTILFECHAAGPEQALVWDHDVMPGIL